MKGSEFKKLNLDEIENILRQTVIDYCKKECLAFEIDVKGEDKHDHIDFVISSGEYKIPIAISSYRPFGVEFINYMHIAYYLQRTNDKYKTAKPAMIFLGKASKHAVASAKQFNIKLFCVTKRRDINKALEKIIQNPEEWKSP